MHGKVYENKQEEEEEDYNWCYHYFDDQKDARLYEILAPKERQLASTHMSATMAPLKSTDTLPNECEYDPIQFSIKEMMEGEEPEYQENQGKEDLIIESLQQEIMDNEVDGSSMESFASIDFATKGEEAQHLAEIDEKLGLFMEQHNSSVMSIVPSTIVFTLKSNYPNSQASEFRDTPVLIVNKATKQSELEFKSQCLSLSTTVEDYLVEQKYKNEYQEKIERDEDLYGEAMNEILDDYKLFPSTGHKILRVGICEHIVTPFIKGGDVKIAIESYIELNNWDKVAKVLNNIEKQLALQRVELQGMKSTYALAVLELNIDKVSNLIAHEKSQRLELPRLRQHKDVEVASMVQSGTSHMKSEIEQLKFVLQTTSGQMMQALSEREQEKNQKEQLSRALDETRKNDANQEARFTERIRPMEEAVNMVAGIAMTLADNMDGFQRHVLPTFKPTGIENKKVVPDHIIEGKVLLEQLTKLENGPSLLRVIVDAKNDTLVLIRGKLKQENEELGSKLQLIQVSKQGKIETIQATNTSKDQDNGAKKTMLRQELQSLRILYNDEVQQLKSELAMYESEEQHGHGKLSKVQKELTTLQEKLKSVEVAKQSQGRGLQSISAWLSSHALRKDNYIALRNMVMLAEQDTTGHNMVERRSMSRFEKTFTRPPFSPQGSLYLGLLALSWPSTASTFSISLKVEVEHHLPTYQRTYKLFLLEWGRSIQDTQSPQRGIQPGPKNKINHYQDNTQLNGGKCTRRGPLRTKRGNSKVRRGRIITNFFELDRGASTLYARREMEKDKQTIDPSPIAINNQTTNELIT
eukprot:Gb_30193 [translate_table: standard]